MKIIPDPAIKLAELAYKIRNNYSNLMESIVKPYSKTEQLTWDIQVKEADLYLVNNQADVPMITTLAQNRGVSINDLVSRIKANESAYRVAIGELLGKQQKELDLLYNS